MPLKMKVNRIALLYSFLLEVLLCLMCFTSCTGNETKEAKEIRSDTLTDEQKRLPGNALKGLVVASDLQVSTMATEPMLKNPTNIDVDERGRVWVTEAYNYRPDINGNPVNTLGDRIMILED